MVAPYTGHWVHCSYFLRLSFLGFIEHLNLQLVFLQIWGIVSPYFFKYFFWHSHLYFPTAEVTPTSVPWLCKPVRLRVFCQHFSWPTWKRLGRAFR